MLQHTQRTLILAGMVLFSGISVTAQESNYANYEVSAISTMLGGAVTAGVKDNSAAYYNPGALAFIEKSNLSIETASFFGGGLKITNGAGTGVNIKSTFFDVIPSMIAGTIKSKKFPDWTFTYVAMTTKSALIRFKTRHEMLYDVISSNPGDELYEGIYDYSNLIRENWLGAAASKIFSDKLGIGASLFGVYYSEEFQLRKEATTHQSIGDSTVTLGFSRLQRDLNFSSLSFLLQIGAVYKLNDSKFGVNITLPNVNIDLIAKGAVSETTNTFIPSSGIQNRTVNSYGDKLKTINKTPFSIALGYELKLIDIDWNFKVSYYTAIGEYTRLSVDQTEDNTSKGSLQVKSDARAILNLALGLRKDIREGLSFLGGFRTDLNYRPDVDAGGIEFVDRMSYWNLYHFTGGVIWYNDRAHLTLGADYALGLSSGNLQQVNLTEPLESNLLFGIRNTDTRTFHSQINVVFGLGISF